MTISKEIFGENKYIEFKAAIPKRHENFLKDIIAFANTSGGKVIIGMEDETGRVIGLGDQNPFRLADAVSNMVSDACTPQIDLEITPRTLDGKTVLEIDVFPGKRRPYYLTSVGKDASAYIRINGTSRPADSRRLKELEMEGRQISYDMIREIGAPYDEAAVEALMQEMYQRALGACRSEAEREEVHPLTVEKLEDFGILCREGREYAPTHAFRLLTHPTDRNIKIQCALFKGNERDEFIDRKEFRGSIQSQVEAACQFVLRHINRSAVINGLYRQEHYELPVKSIREIIANACVHRSYLDSAAIQVSIYDNRIEVDSPGVLYDGLSVEEALSGKSKCRNRAVAEAFQYMKIIEGWGTGLPRLFRQCREMALPEPRFEEFGDGIKVTVYRRTAAPSGASPKSYDANSQASQAVNDANEANYEANYEANRGANTAAGEANTDLSVPEQILIHIRRDPGITQPMLAEKIGVSRSTIQRYMRQMMKDGFIRRYGRTRGYWEAVGDQNVTGQI